MRWPRRRPVLRYYNGVFDAIECWRLTQRGADRAIERLKMHVDQRDRAHYQWVWAEWSRSDWSGR